MGSSKSGSSHTCLKKPVNKHKLLIISGPVDLSSNICLSHSGINIKIVEFRPFPVVCSSVFGVVFGWVSKVIPDCIGFALLRSVIGPENSRHSLNQSDAKQRTITTWSPVFSRALGISLGFSASSPFFFCGIFFRLLGQSDNFGFRCTTLNRKAL